MKSAFDKKRLMREIEQDRRAKVVRRLAELGVLLKAARAARRDSIEGIRRQCRAAREKLRNMCGARIDRARDQGNEVVGKRRGELHDERHLEKLQRAADRPRQGAFKKGKDHTDAVRRERQSESDDEVRQNVPPGMTRVFDKVKRHIKGSDRKSRTEAFLEWAEENPGEVYAIQEQDAAREIKRMVREQARAERVGALERVPF